MNNHYRFSPTLLNSYYHYTTQKTFFGKLAVTKAELLQRINRIKTPPSLKMLKGIAFEEAVMNKTYHANGFDFRSTYTDIVIEQTHGGVWQERLFYKFEAAGMKFTIVNQVDVIKQNYIKDIKTSGIYEFPGFLNDFQHRSYLAACMENNIPINLHRYIICDFDDVWFEDYCFDYKMVEDIQRASIGLAVFINENIKYIFNETIWKEQSN